MLPDYIALEEKVDPHAFQNPTRFSVLNFFLHRGFGVKEAVICLTVTVNAPDYSRSQEHPESTRKYV